MNELVRPDPLGRTGAQHEGVPMTDVTVLVGSSVHAVSGRPTRSPADAIAVTLALGLPGQMRMLCAGAMPDAVARDYLALGASRLEVLESAPGDDVAATLLPTLRNAGWILTGTRSEAEQGSGMLPFSLAAALGRALITEVLAVRQEGSCWVVLQALPKGARRQLRVSAPAVLAISASAPLTLRHSLADALAGTIMRSAVAPAPVAAVGRLVPRGRRRTLLQARTTQSGHARMLGAIESPATGGTVVQIGSPQAKAQAVLDYLRAHSLVHF